MDHLGSESILFLRSIFEQLLMGLCRFCKVLGSQRCPCRYDSCTRTRAMQFAIYCNLFTNDGWRMRLGGMFANSNNWTIVVGVMCLGLLLLLRWWWRCKWRCRRCSWRSLSFWMVLVIMAIKMLNEKMGTKYKCRRKHLKQLMLVTLCKMEDLEVRSIIGDLLDSRAVSIWNLSIEFSDNCFGDELSLLCWWCDARWTLKGRQKQTLSTLKHKMESDAIWVTLLMFIYEFLK